VKKQLILALALSMACAALVVAQDEEAAPAQPKIACDEPTFNFGEKDQNVTVEHTFVLRNDGNATLQIGNVRTSCGCTVANVSNKTLEPGQTAEVTARLSLKGRQGQQRKAITVESNDPATPQLQLYLEGNATATVTVTPDKVYFGQLDENAAVTGVVSIVASGDTTIHITQVDAGSDAVTVTSETVEDGKNYRVLVSPRTPIPAGSISGVVRVLTDSAQYPQINIPITGIVLDQLMVAPNEIVLSEDGVHGVTRYVVVRPGKTKTFELLSVEPPDATMQYEITALGENGYQIKLDNVIAGRDLDGKDLKLTTNVEGMNEIKIPFRVIPAPQPPPQAPAPPPA